jgi:PII-like signaling protein
LRGIEGFGARSVLHKPHRLHLSVDHPPVIEVVDSAEKIDAVMPELDELMGDGLITAERVELVTYRARLNA